MRKNAVFVVTRDHLYSRSCGGIHSTRPDRAKRPSERKRSRCRPVVPTGDYSAASGPRAASPVRGYNAAPRRCDRTTGSWRPTEIGRTQVRERVCQNAEISVAPTTLIQKDKTKKNL